ncbi:MAG: cold shock domain-containing protein [Candidatus Cloacimonetes bacterium]|nr:cold shock domain-containing protein [Candidatus Cloacimonadota bacterium]MCF7813366.1 cold shock domain-containing protein [Candidatus Cloacimonadota bacterium]MCF7867509.1 cold shock domain-containing protein [Candidatus Cloacimonadota bacterium]MCF7882989.1 cold shock domain-containing protein [Candidatus Cloacimonadota bacterium]
MNGRVKWFDDSKGYGFVLTDDGKEYFVHWKSIVTISEKSRKFLVPDEEVQFDLMETDKGTQAINVVRLNP